MLRTKVALALTLLVVGTAQAQEPGSKRYPVTGAGTNSCGMYTAARSDSGGAASYIYTGWAQGYLSALNIARHINGKGYVTLPDHMAIEAYMDNYCQAHPLEGFGTGVGLLMGDLIKQDAVPHG